jgi:hypothetical protein
LDFGEIAPRLSFFLYGTTGMSGLGGGSLFARRSRRDSHVSISMYPVT